jgi:hypothetical protein
VKHSSFSIDRIDQDSDGSTPEKQTQQILAVASIIRGQKSTEKNEIPPHRRTESYDGTVAAHTQPPTADSGNEKNLINFDSTGTTAPPPVVVHAVEPQNGGQPQSDLEKTHKSTETQQQDSLTDFHGDLKASLPSAPENPNLKLKRNDTDNSSLDEFVDARG